MKDQGLSVTIIARNEEDRIADAIRSVLFADEIVVLDSGSTDGTVALSRSLGARVIETDWPGYVAQKNRALEFAKHDWVLSIDADERVSDELAKSIRTSLSKSPAVAGFWVARRQRYLGRWIRFCGWYPDRRIRLFRRTASRWVGTDPHDRIEVRGTAGRLSGDLLHIPYRSLSDHVDTINRYAAIFAKEAQSQGRRARWWDILFRPPFFFLKRYLLNLGFLDGVEGMIVCGMGAFHVLCRWAKLFELQKGLARHS
jgi:(heptosyl)LPS beta-1,4-glucosyltransferase